MTNKRDQLLASLKTDAEREAFVMHERWMAATNDMIAEGHDPRIVVEAMATTVASAAIMTLGAIGAARLMLAIYLPIRDVAVAAEEASNQVLQ